MQFVVLGSPKSWYLRDLTRAAGTRHTIVPATFRDLHATVASTESEQLGAAHATAQFTSGSVDLARADAVLVRTMPPGALEQVVFRMDVLARVEAAGVVVMNPPRAIEAAVDKYLSTARLAAAGLRVPRTYVCQTAEDAMQAFALLGGDVVIKPLFGAEGRGITRLSDAALAERTFALLERLGAVLYLQEYIDHEGFDLRLLLVGDEVLAVRRRNPLDWRTNVSRGATAEAFVPDDALVDLARRAARAVAAPIAGVDLLPARSGALYVIEVNAVPGWRATAAAAGVDVARMVLDFVAATVDRAQRS